MPFPRSQKMSLKSILSTFLSSSGRGVSGSVADAELQAAADSLSRAGAAELDQRNDSIQRSSSAILNLLSHDQNFARGDSNIEIETITYFNDIPQQDYRGQIKTTRCENDFPLIIP